MKTVTVALLVLLAATAGAQDIRQAQQKARQDRAAAVAEAAALEARILADRTGLVALVDSLEARQAALEAERRELRSRQTEAEQTRCTQHPAAHRGSPRRVTSLDSRSSASSGVIRSGSTPRSRSSTSDSARPGPPPAKRPS